MTAVLVFMLKAGACLTLFFGIYWLLLRNETFFRLNRGYLVSTLLLSFLIPALPVRSPFVTAPAGLIDFAPESAPAMGPSIAWIDLLAGVYAAGVLLALLRLAFHLVKMGLLIRRRGVRRNDGLKIVSVAGDFSPFSFLGFVFVNDQPIAPRDWRRILAHEQVHIRQRHSLDVLLMEFAASLQWFNPFVWPYKKALTETHEYLADSGVIAQGFSSVKYQLLMFEQHVGARLCELGHNFKQSQIKRRITMISKHKSTAAAKLKLLLAAPLAVLLVLAFAIPRPAASAPAFAPQEKSGPTVEKTDLTAKVAEMKSELEKLAGIETELRKKLDAATDDTTRSELKAKLKEVLMREEKIGAFLKDPEAYSKKVAMAADFEALNKKEATLKAKLGEVTDPEEKAKIEKTLEMIAAKKAEMKAKSAQIAGHGPMDTTTVEGLKAIMEKLVAAEAEVKAKLEKTGDAAEKAELGKKLEQIHSKQADVKAKMHELKSSHSEK